MNAVARDVIAELALLSQAQRRWVIGRMSEAHRRELSDRWAAWAHAGQHAPMGDWRVWLIRAGRGFGKTRAGAEWVSQFARDHPGARIALVGDTVADVVKVMVEGASGLIAVARAGEVPLWRAHRGVLTFANDAVAQVFSANAPEALRGPEHHAAWCDELAKWPAGAQGGDAAWDNLMLGLRAGARPRALVTTTPRPTALMRRVMAMEGLVETRGRTRDNPHLPPGFVADMDALYAGTRLGRQELEGEMVDDVAGALWTRDGLEACRRAPPVAVDRVVVGVDPPAGVGGDACGIVAVALVGRVGDGGVAHVLEDASVVGATPEGWARTVAACAARHGADRVVAEANQGGAMVRSVLIAADAGLPVTLVHATRGKVARAEPVAALYACGKVRHAGAFPALEDELCGLVTGGGYEGPGRSPDRADALVWAVTELMLGRRGGVGVRGL